MGENVLGTEERTFTIEDLHQKRAEAEALEAIYQAGYEIEFALVKETSIGTWDKFRGQFGFK